MSTVQWWIVTMEKKSRIDLCVSYGNQSSFVAINVIIRFDFKSIKHSTPYNWFACWKEPTPKYNNFEGHTSH